MSEKRCKPGKAPNGKNGRCVFLKRCKSGKVPEGKNGRCITPKRVKRRYHRKTKKNVSMSKQMDNSMKKISESMNDSSFFTPPKNSPQDQDSSFKTPPEFQQVRKQISFDNFPR